MYFVQPPKPRQNVFGKYQKSPIICEEIVERFEPQVETCEETLEEKGQERSAHQALAQAHEMFIGNRKYRTNSLDMLFLVSRHHQLPQ